MGEWEAVPSVEVNLIVVTYGLGATSALGVPQAEQLAKAEAETVIGLCGASLSDRFGKTRKVPFPVFVSSAG